MNSAVSAAARSRRRCSAGRRVEEERRRPAALGADAPVEQMAVAGGAHGGVGRLAGQVGQFPGIGLEVIQLVDLTIRMALAFC